jgi:hypothetical protein
MCPRFVHRMAIVTISTLLVGGCNRVDQKKFDALYRAGKEIEVDIDNSSAVRVAESEKLLKRFKTEISLLQGRSANKNEAAALSAYDNAAAAYKAFLDMRDMDLRGDAREGRMLLGEGWVAVGSKFNFEVEPAPSKPDDEYKWYWVKVGEAVGALLEATKKNLTEANRLVNGAT